MPHSRCVVHHKLVRLDPLRLTQPSHLEHLHNSELQLGGIELQLRSHLNGQRRDIGGFKQGSSERPRPWPGRPLPWERRASQSCQVRPEEPKEPSRALPRGLFDRAVAPLVCGGALANARAEFLPR